MPKVWVIAVKVLLRPFSVLQSRQSRIVAATSASILCLKKPLNRLVPHLPWNKCQGEFVHLNFSWLGAQCAAALGVHGPGRRVGTLCALQLSVCLHGMHQETRAWARVGPTFARLGAQIYSAWSHAAERGSEPWICIGSSTSWQAWMVPGKRDCSHHQFL